ncbi:hypothetical protein D3C81_2077700 [compost metagenome]
MAHGLAVRADGADARSRQAALGQDGIGRFSESLADQRVQAAEDVQRAGFASFAQ